MHEDGVGKLVVGVEATALLRGGGRLWLIDYYR